MHEFLSQITERAASALSRLEAARQDGDDYAAQVALGEVESIRHLAAEHGLHLPGIERALPA